MVIVDPDIKRFSCVKGAFYGFRAAEGSLRRISVAVPFGTRRFFFFEEENNMETRVAVMSIIVENGEAVERLNAILHEYGEYIIGRMGIPYRARGVNIIAIAMDAPQNTISALAGKVGSLNGISVKTAYSNKF